MPISANFGQSVLYMMKFIKLVTGQWFFKYSSPHFIRLLLPQWKSDLIRELPSLEQDTFKCIWLRLDNSNDLFGLQYSRSPNPQGEFNQTLLEDSSLKIVFYRSILLQCGLLKIEISPFDISETTEPILTKLANQDLVSSVGPFSKCHKC